MSPAARLRACWATRKAPQSAGKALVIVMLTTLSGSLSGVISPAFSRIFMDRLLTGQNPEWLWPFVLALAGVSLLQLIVAWMQAI